MHCFCVCSGSALLGDLLGVSKSRERDLLSVLFIYPRFLCVCSICIVPFFVFVLFCYNLMHVRCFGLVVNTCLPPSVWPHLFCCAGHEKRRGEQLKWSLAFRLYIGSFPCAQLPGPVHTARLGRVCFIFSREICILCVCIALICLCVPILLCFPGQFSHLPYRFWRWRK